MLEGARNPISLSPTVKTVKANANATFKLSSTSITLNSTLAEQSMIVSVNPSQANVDVVIPDPVFVPANKQSADAADDIYFEIIGSSIIVSVEPGTSARTCKFEIRPNGIARPLVLTVKVNDIAQGVKNSNLSASVKADKANINLMDQANTMRTYSPTIKGTTSAIVDVRAVERTNLTSKSIRDGHELFEATWNPLTRKVEVRTIPGETYHRGASYGLRFEFDLGDGNKLRTGNVTIKPTTSTVKHSIPKQAQNLMYQSRTGVENSLIINLTPTTPTGARIETLRFKTNPNNAFMFFFDESSQELYIWIKDSATVKPGKATLTFSATYDGQGVEATGANKDNPRPTDIKIPVNVLK